MFFSSELILGILAGLVLATVIMLVLQVRNSLQINKLTFPAYEYVVKQAEHKANEIINEAQKEARALLAEAEKRGQKTFSQYHDKAVGVEKTYIEGLEKNTSTYNEKLMNVTSASLVKLEALSTQVSAAMHSREQTFTKQFDSSLEALHGLTLALDGRATKALTNLDERVTALSEKLAADLQGKVHDQQERIERQLAQVLKTAEDEIGSYKKARIALIDGHIERLVEDIALRVLHKKLTMSEHATLAREALAESKIDVIV